MQRKKVMCTNTKTLKKVKEGMVAKPGLYFYACFQFTYAALGLLAHST